MKISAAAKVGFTTVVLVLVVVLIYRGMGWRIPWISVSKQEAFVLYVSFENVKGLDPGAEVTLNGKPIGEVGDIENTEYGKVRVQLLIRKFPNLRIHENAKFVISRENIFGGFTVTITEPPSAKLIREDEQDEGAYVLQVGGDTVDEGADVVLRNQVVGRIEDVESIETDPPMDRIELTLPGKIKLESTMAFIPTDFGPDNRGIVIYRLLPDSEEVVGNREAGPEDLVASADEALGEIAGEASVLIERLSELIDNVSKLVDTEKVNLILDNLAEDTKAIADNVETLTEELNSLISESSPHILASLENVESATADAKTMLDGFSRYDDPELREDIKTLARNLSEASETLEKILVDLEEITSDAQFKDEIKGTITDARATLDKARTTLDSANVAIEDASETVESLWGFEASGNFRLRMSPDDEDWAGDVAINLGASDSDAFVSLGLDDIGEDEEGSLQFGWWITEETAGRVGVYRGKVGLGLDWRDNKTSLKTDFYDPNNLKWDLYAGYAVVPELDVVLGVEDFLDDDQLNLALNFRF